MSRALISILTSVGAVMASAFAVWASIVWSEWDGDILIIGEFHDNPAHHARQQNAVNEIAPKAVVFEMLTPEEARALSDVARDPAAMRAATKGFHWSNIADYGGVLAVSPVILGAALPRDAVRTAFEGGAAAVFGDEAEDYGLNTALDPSEQAQRQSLQYDAHCAAMPKEMMGGMVEAQRLRDAAFARTVIEAVDTYGSPVVLITGNGHARVDWGVPTYLAHVRPDLRHESIGQGEDGVAPAGTFTSVLHDAAAPPRLDPCAAFQ